MLQLFKTLAIIFTLSPLIIVAQSWTTPVNVSKSVNLNAYPSLAIDSNNIYHIVWAHRVSSTYWMITHAQSNDEGNTWSEPDTVLDIPNSWLWVTHLVCDQHNQMIVTYDSISWDGTYTQVYAITNNGSSWSAPFKLSSTNNAKENRLTIDKEGNVYCFWHEIYNGNTKFLYRNYKNGTWGETTIPYSDSDVYVLENLDTDMENNIHAIGYYLPNGQPSDQFVTAYFYYQKSINQWLPPFIVSNNYPYQGCDIVSDSLQLPHTVTNDYINQAPIDFATLHRKQTVSGWEPPDTVLGHREEFNPQIEINADNNQDIILAELITNDNLILNNYYKINDSYIIETIDNDGSIMFKNLQRQNSKLLLVYGKMSLDAGLNSDVYFTSKSINVATQNITQVNNLKLFPNPCSTDINISLLSNIPEKCTLMILDINGRILWSESNKELIVGNNLINLNLEIRGLINNRGTYFLLIQTKKMIKIAPFIISK